jgi:ABC-type multidrug transport system ATPase subunit
MQTWKSSGSGKTTLLNVLAYRLDPVRQGFSGQLRINGKEYQERDFKAFGAYVSQDPVLFSEFTVFETLWYTAELVLYNTTDRAGRLERVNEVIKLFDLNHCRNVIVGNSRFKGISGGKLLLVVVGYVS